MVRPRTFNVDEALYGAMIAFWAKGYKATLMANLTGAMGLEKGSIYAAFADKHSTFLCALKKYSDATYTCFKRILSGGKLPYDGMKALAEELVEYVAGGESRRGCLDVNSMIELAPHDDEVKNLLERHVKRNEALLAEYAERGRNSGSTSMLGN